MGQEFSRREIYELLWAEPVRTVAARLGVSDVALAKHCKRANVPLPPRGYWARKQAGKTTSRIPLPLRFPGATDRLGLSTGRQFRPHQDWADEFATIEVPPVPVFKEDLDAVRARSAKIVGKVRFARSFSPAHPLVAKLLAHDEARRIDYAKWGSAFYAPKYDAGPERRRLLIVNMLFLAAAKMGCRPSMSTSRYTSDSARELTLSIGQSQISFSIEELHPNTSSAKHHLALTMRPRYSSKEPSLSWQDSPEQTLQDQLTEILIEMLVQAECRYRQSLIDQREWRIKRKAEAKLELQNRKTEAEKRERALQERLARERIQRLLSEARSVRRADEIRQYVEAVLANADSGTARFTRADCEGWANWAREQADAIDPLKNGTVQKAIRERAGA